ncbi:MAG: SGNH/GDSL hydrolase family protein [Candidatus Woesearchaeota archaeon]|nr:SGNH/GDSL hydrolase family protein [Candidatus Woesearchaeota archaeon]
MKSFGFTKAEKILLAIIIFLALVLAFLYLSENIKERAKIGEKEELYKLYENRSYYMLKISENRKLVFEFVPNYESVYYGDAIKINGTQININGDGFRDRNFSVEKPNGIYRIIALGDSFTFGSGVELNETYSKVLETELNKGKSNFSYEVLNMGVIIYSTENEVEFLKVKGLKYSPDIVMVGYLPNDVENITRLNDIKYHLSEELIKKGQEIDIFTSEIHTPATIELHKEMEGKSFDEIFRIVKIPLEELNTLSKDNKFKVVIVYFPVEGFFEAEKQREEVERTSLQNGWCFIDLTQLYSEQDLYSQVFGKEDRHPNAYAHKIIGEEIAKKIKECNLLPE